MESLLSLFIFHDNLIITLLVLGITTVVVLLLLFNQKSPESVVKSELGGERIEGALRRVLGEQAWFERATREGAATQPGSENLAELQKEVLEKDRQIAELNKQLTHSTGAGSMALTAGGDNSDLLAKIKELEGRLEEYEIIEDDIADLSLYRTENEKLKQEIARLKGLAGQPIEDSHEVEAEALAEDPPVEEVEDDDVVIREAMILNDETPKRDPGVDLVAEFEKVVSSQEQMESGQSGGTIRVKSSESSGKVVIAGQFVKGGGGASNEVHPKLERVNPDSKEEAEVFISELKTLQALKIKKGSE